MRRERNIKMLQNVQEREFALMPIEAAYDAAQPRRKCLDAIDLHLIGHMTNHPRHSPQTIGMTLPEPRRALERTASGTCLSAGPEVHDAWQDHMASIVQPGAPLDLWAKQAIARTLHANIGTLRRIPEGDGSYACEWALGQSHRSILLIEANDTWQVWVPSRRTVHPLHQSGHTLDVPLTGSDGFVFAAALACDYRDVATPFAQGHQSPRERAYALTHHPVFQMHAKGGAPTLANFAASVNHALRFETQQQLAQQPEALLHDLWTSCAGMLHQTQTHSKTFAQLPAGDPNREAANAAAYCLINDASRVAPALGHRVMTVVDKRRDELESIFW